jgi:hypothetical protein
MMPKTSRQITLAEDLSDGVFYTAGQIEVEKTVRTESWKFCRTVDDTSP